MTAPMPDIQANLERVREQIRTAAVAAGRRPGEIRLVAVSKYMPESYLREAMQVGQHVFGENTVQDALGKLRVLQEPGNEWHFIGHLQTNKAKHIPGNFSWLHTLDSIKLANRLARHCQETHSTLNILIQVNVGYESAKFGVAPEDAENLIRQVSGLANVKIQGLMTIPPFFNAPERVRPYFAALKQLHDQIKAQNIPRIVMDELSMGMTGDFEAAIAEGATMVRIGTAIFGERH